MGELSLFDNVTALATGALSIVGVWIYALNIGDYFEPNGDTLLVDRAMLDSLVLLMILAKSCSNITDMKDSSWSTLVQYRHRLLGRVTSPI